MQRGLTALAVWVVSSCGSAPRPVAHAAPPDALRCRTDSLACEALSTRPVARAALQTRCDGDDQDACFELGLAYADGRGGAKNAERALALYEHACRVGHPVACGLAGVAYTQGLGTRVDLRAAVRMYTAGCDGNEPVSCDLLGRAVEDGHGIAQDRDAAVKLFERACRLRPGAGCRDQAIAMMRGSRHDRRTACALLDKGCSASDAQACDALASACEDLFPAVARNLETLQWTTTTCQQSHEADACVRAGTLLEGAPGIPAAASKAEQMYREGCRLGSRGSCLAQATLYASHRASGDASQVVSEACERDVAGMCLAAGRAFLAGQIVPRDPARATTSFERACANADAEGCLELAHIRRDPAGFRRACALGNLDACREGARLPALARDVADALAAQACFHHDTTACATAPAGLEVATRSIALEWTYMVKSLAFVGDDKHALLASSGDGIALVDPAGSVAAGWVHLSSPQRTGPQPEGWKLVHTVDSAAWTWDAAAHVLAGIIGESGYGIVERGIATWSPGSRSQPALLLPITSHTFGAQAVSADGRFAIARDQDGTPGARLLDLHARKPIGDDLATGFVRCAAFSPDGRRAAIGFDNGKLAIVATDTGAHAILDASRGAITSVALDPTRPRLVSVDLNARVRLWSLDGHPEAAQIAEHASSAAFSPDGRFLALAASREIVVLDTTTLERVRRPVELEGGGGDAIAFSGDSRYLAVANAKGVTIVDFTPHAAAAPVATAWFRAIVPLPVPAPPPSPPFGRAGSIHGVLTSANKPLAGADVELVPSPREWPDARALPPRRLRADKDGRYAVDKLAEIEWLVTASTPNTVVASSYVDLRGGHERTLDLSPAPAIALSGRVLDPSGKPAAGARVIVGNVTGAEAVADGTGRFTLRHVWPGGQVRVHASRADGSVVSIEVPVEAKPPELVLHLVAASDPHVARFRIVDPAGHPIAGAHAEIDGVPEGITDARGIVSCYVATEHRMRQPAIQVWIGNVVALSQLIDLPQRGVVTLTTR